MLGSRPIGGILPKCRILARRTGVLDRFVFAGFRTDVARLMLAADLCVLCTHFEGLPLVLIEAMAAERPCVATAVDGIPEALTDGVTGLLHRPGDAEGLAAAIARLIAAPVRAEAMGAAARAEAERRFSRDRFARDVRALYEGLSGTRGMGQLQGRGEPCCARLIALGSASPAAIIIARLLPLDPQTGGADAAACGHLAMSWFALREWAGLLAQRMGF